MIHYYHLDGTNDNFCPPPVINKSLYSISTSSNVSMQSKANPGVITNKSFITSSVYGG
jgi:hypothetical protein